MHGAFAPTTAEPLTTVDGVLSLVFRPAHDGTDISTVVDILAQRPPLRVVRPFRLPDGAALLHLHNVSGGVVKGDRLAMEVEVRPGARAQLTTTGATRIYGGRHTESSAQQDTTITVGEDALLEYLPDPLIPYAGSVYLQRTRFTLAAGAGLFAWDVFAPGRAARGEIFAYDRLSWETTIAAGDIPIVVERACLEPGVRPVDSPARLGPYRYFASFYACRVGVDAGQWANVERSLAALACELTVPGTTLWGASCLPAHGIAIRGVSMTGRSLLAALPRFWSAAKRLLYGQESHMPRKIY